MKACCQRCGALLPVKDDRFYPVCIECETDAPLFSIRTGIKSHIGLMGIPEAVRRTCWWVKTEQLVVERERYARV